MTDIKTLLKKNKYVFGKKEAMRELLKGNAKVVIISSDCPKEVREDIEYYTKIANVELLIYPGSAYELAELCGRPHPIAVISVIEGA